MTCGRGTEQALTGEEQDPDARQRDEGNVVCSNLPLKEGAAGLRKTTLKLPASILHPWPGERFDVRTRGKSPVR